jgi:multidrug efflux pump subunit AcrB
MARAWVMAFTRQSLPVGCLIRFRPIMMTTMAALLGAVPIRPGLRRWW